MTVRPLNNKEVADRLMALLAQNRFLRMKRDSDHETKIVYEISEERHNFVAVKKEFDINGKLLSQVFDPIEDSYEGFVSKEEVYDFIQSELSRDATYEYE